MYKLVTKKEVITVEESVSELSLLEYIGARVKYYREKKGLSGTDVARGSGLNMSPSSVTNMERALNHPNLATIVGVAKGLGVDVMDLFPQKEVQVEVEKKYNDIAPEPGIIL